MSMSKLWNAEPFGRAVVGFIAIAIIFLLGAALCTIEAASY